LGRARTFLWVLGVVSSVFSMCCLGFVSSIRVAGVGDGSWAYVLVLFSFYSESFWMALVRRKLFSECVTVSHCLLLPQLL
jgi:hypothetical protein